MMQQDVVVYLHRSTDYLARFGDGAWWVWPAQEGGWLLRRPASEDDADPDRELEPRLARLALLLSGVTSDA